MSFALLGRSNSNGFDFLNSLSFRMTCSQSFLLENLTMVLSLTLFRRWDASILSPIMSTPICWSTLQTISLSSFCLELTKVTPPPQHAHVASIGCFSSTASHDICLDRILFTFLITETSDSSFWKFSFKRLISTVSGTMAICNIKEVSIDSLKQLEVANKVTYVTN